jgi:hypothetical protein
VHGAFEDGTAWQRRIPRSGACPDRALPRAAGLQARWRAGRLTTRRPAYLSPLTLAEPISSSFAARSKSAVPLIFCRLKKQG